MPQAEALAAWGLTPPLRQPSFQVKPQAYKNNIDPAKSSAARARTWPEPEETKKMHGRSMLSVPFESTVSQTVKGGDKVSCTVSELQPLRAEAEDIPLDIVYEDEHLLVVNKPAHMVVHPAPGNANGTLVNAILHHCKISTFTCLARSPIYDECPESSDDDVDVFDVDQFTIGEVSSEVREAIVRPGIVHRLDKGTSGLLVVAKDEHSHAQLAEQFKLHTISRVYISLTCGVPSPNSARIEVPISRDPNNRIRMVAAPGSGHRYAKHAASRYKVREVFCAGGSALVEWRLETGRTHQIRAHAKYLGNPLLGDETYGGTKSMALSLLRPRTPSKYHGDLTNLVSKIDRPCLHAALLGFKHPHSGKVLEFSCPPPDDFTEEPRENAWLIKRVESILAQFDVCALYRGVKYTETQCSCEMEILAYIKTCCLLEISIALMSYFIGRPVKPASPNNVGISAPSLRVLYKSPLAEKSFTSSFNFPQQPRYSS
ncbi:RNA pseudourine synthase 2, chloroplastic [Triticum urartu]|uniref:RNA pseudourine synthase 2, chloroplastic n=1 Tax=Triticum urartu TaxID=4572 RepID=M8A1R1_TRIUA|nr:RNA pseudourine synthase 2, chloroplastic [Triticum urartu]